MFKRAIIRLASVVVLFNLALVLLTIFFTWQSESAHPMQGRLVSAGDQQLHVIQSGNDISGKGSTVVLIHGASTSALDFSTNLHPALSKKHKVISIDRPGHGYSQRESMKGSVDPAIQASMILDALHTLGIDKPVLVGHSWAGSVVMAALLNKHAKVQPRAGILIAGATHPWTGDSVWHAELSARPLIGDVFVWQYVSPMGRLSLESAVASVFSPEQAPVNYIDNTGLTLSLRPSTYKANAYDRTLLSAYLEQQAPRYSGISVPLLSIASDEDHVVPMWNHHDRLTEQIADLHTLVLDKAGHAPHHTRPEQIIKAIESFIDELP